MADTSKIQDLEDQIRRHNQLYYDQDSPEISDVEYDTLKAELQKLAPESSVLTEEIGNTTFGEPVKHTTLVASLPKCHTSGEIVAKFGDKKVVWMPKVDGLSLTLRYESGKLTLAATRGNGYQGENVIANAKYIKDIPQNISYEGVVEIRGEGVIYKVDFYGTMDQPGYGGKPEGMVNPRNAAAGAVRQKDAKVTAERNVRFVAYKAIFPAGEGVVTQTEAMNFLESQGFKICPFETVDMYQFGTPAVEHKIEAYHIMDWPYETDGVVIILDSFAEYEAAGVTGKYPKGALAYKFADEKAVSKVTGIEWTTTRQGRVVPVAVIEPTEICGSTVSRITMNNIEWLENTDVGVGDRIEFIKANEIIPQLSSVLDRAITRIRNTPHECPSCGGDLSREGVDIVCRNDGCPAQFIKYIRHILVKLNVKGLAEATLSQMEEKGLLKEPWDIFGLNVNQLTMAGFGQGEAENWVEVLSCVTTTPQKLLACMGIACWGERMFELLFQNSRKDDKFWMDMILTGSEDDLKASLASVKGIGPAKTEALLKGVKRGKEVVGQLMSRVKVEYPSQNASGTATLGGKSFLITGALSKGRNDVEAAIKASGGVLKSSVSKNLDFLVVGEEPGSKVDKARAAGVKMIGEAELYEMIEKGV